MTCPLKVPWYSQTRAGFADSAEIIFADTGCGITAEQKEKLFLPYFSTKGRGTGLGIGDHVSHILTEHGASVRVEDNQPLRGVVYDRGARQPRQPPEAVRASERDCRHVTGWCRKQNRLPTLAARKVA